MVQNQEDQYVRQSAKSRILTELTGFIPEISGRVSSAASLVFSIDIGERWSAEYAIDGADDRNNLA